MNHFNQHEGEEYTSGPRGPRQLRHARNRPLEMPSGRYRHSSRSSGGHVSVNSLLVLLGFLMTGILFLLLWPYRVEVFHALLLLLGVLAIAALLVAVAKVTRFFRRRRDDVPSYQRKDIRRDTHSGYLERQRKEKRSRSRPSSPDAPEPKSYYDYKQYEQFPEQLNPDQGNRF